MLNANDQLITKCIIIEKCRYALKNNELKRVNPGVVTFYAQRRYSWSL